MSRIHESSMSQEMRDLLHDEPPTRRRQLERVWMLLDEAGEGEAPAPSKEDAWISILGAIDDAEALDKNARRPPDRLGFDHGASGRLTRNRRSSARGTSNRRESGLPAVRRRRVAATAVAFTIVVLIGIWWMFRPVTVSVAAGEQRTVQLPDGSVVELNSDTSIRFARRTIPLPVKALQTRTVSLDGEAYFRVVSSTGPFVVRTDDADIEVLGTEFNVRARRGPAEAGTVVSLAIGKVRLTPRAGSRHSATLAEIGASALISRTAGVTRAEPGLAAPLDHVLAWRQNGFAVVDRPLQVVLDEVERRFAIEITPRNGVNLMDPMSAFYLRGAAPDQILRDICLVHTCTYRETSRGFALSARGSTAAAPSAGSSPDRASRTQ